MKALEYYERYLSNKRIDTAVEQSVGLLYLTQKKYTLGFKYLKRYAYRKHTEESLLMLAKHYHWSGFNQEALGIIKKLTAYYPKSSGAKRLKEAVMASPLSPRDKYLIAANRAYQKGEYERATPLFQKYLERYADDSYIRNRYAYALGKIEKHTEAIGEFAKVLQIKPMDLNTQYYYAYNLEKLKRYQLAKAMYIQIIKSTRKSANKSFIKFTN